MKIDSILKTILSITIVFTIIISYNKITKSNYDYEETLAYDNVSLDMSNNSDSEVIEFTNTYGYPVELNCNDLYIIPTGETREDEELVEQNMKMTVTFKETMDSKPVSTIIVDKKETIYIIISSNYEGEMPTSPVDVQFGINIGLS